MSDPVDVRRAMRYSLVGTLVLWSLFCCLRFALEGGEQVFRHIPVQ